jgi:hypothetical protein
VIAEPVNLATDYHGHVIDFVCDFDRAFLVAHPDVHVFERPAVDHEFCDMLAGGVPETCFGFEGVVVRVYRGAIDGVRVRWPLWDGMVLPRIPARWSR